MSSKNTGGNGNSRQPKRRLRRCGLARVSQDEAE
jgi:hypothetical protein